MLDIRNLMTNPNTLPPPPAYLPPYISVPDSVRGYIGQVINEVANVIVSNATAHAGRILLYNQATQQGWNNPTFFYVVKLALDMIAVYSGTQKMTAFDSLGGVASTAVVFYLSNLVVSERSVALAMDPEAYQKAVITMGHYEGVLADIQRYYAPPTHQSVPNQQPYQQYSDSRMQLANPYTQSTNIYGNQQRYTETIGPVSRYSVGDRIAPQLDPLPRPGVAYIHPRTPVHSVVSTPIAEQVPVYAPLPREEVVKSPVQVLEELAKLRIDPDSPTSIADQNILNSTVCPFGGPEMDRTKHQIVYGGEVRPIRQTVIRNQTYEKAVDSLVSAKIEVTGSMDKDVSDVVVDSISSHTLHPLILSEMSLEDMMFSVNVLQYDKQGKEGPGELFRAFGHVINPSILTTDISSYVGLLNKCTSFTEIQSVLLSIIHGVKDKEDDTTACLLTYLSRLDIVLTGLVNNFLANNLKVTYNIDSFSEDITALKETLLLKDGLEYEAAFNFFEATVISSVFSSYEKEALTKYKDELELSECLWVGLIPISYSVTRVFLNNRELGYSVGTKPMIVDKEMTPLLYAICVSCIRHKGELGFTTIHDLLVTADNVIYVIDYNMVNKTYLISRK